MQACGRCSRISKEKMTLEMTTRTKLKHPAVHEKEPEHLKVSEQCSLSVRLKDTPTAEGEQIRHPRKATEVCQYQGRSKSWTGT